MWKAVVQFSLCLVALLAFVPSYAQTNADTPLVVSAKNRQTSGIDLYAYDGAQWEQLTTSGCTYGVQISPNGGQVAFLSAPSFICSEEAQSQGYGYLLGAGWNIDLLDLTTGEQRQVAGQPPDVELPLVHGAIQRSQPVWSPDGQSLAWTEQDYPTQNSARLVVYNLTRDEIHVLDAALPLMTMSASGLPTFIAWGMPGIVVFTNEASGYIETLRLYDPEDDTVTVIQLSDIMDDDWIPLGDLLWIEGDSGVILAVRAGESMWYTVDFNSEQITGLGHYLMLRSANHTADSLSMVWFPYGDGKWTLVDAEGRILHTLPIEQNPLSLRVLSPDGQAAAFQTEEGLFLWHAGAVEPLPLPDSLILNKMVWGAPAWTLSTPIGAIG